MRRLLLLLIGLVGLGALVPCAPAAAASHRTPHAAMPAMPCHDDKAADTGVHACLGCAMQPDAAFPVAEAITPRAPAPALPRLARLADHRTGFDPPPPRRAV